MAKSRKSSKPRASSSKSWGNNKERRLKASAAKGAKLVSVKVMKKTFRSKSPPRGFKATSSTRKVFVVKGHDGFFANLSSALKKANQIAYGKKR